MYKFLRRLRYGFMEQASDVQLPLCHPGSLLSALRISATNESVNSENDQQLAWLASVMLLRLLYETCRRAES